ncbi:carboxypeptidase-like regulatory domain-containing protein [Bacteroidota bacterium]
MKRSAKPKLSFLLILIIASVFSGFSAFPLQSEYFVSGYVFDKETKAALSNVNISIVGSNDGSITNSEGYFKINLKKIPALLYFSHIGYKIDYYQVNKNNENINIYLEAESQDIDEVTVSAERIQKVFKKDTLNIVDYQLLDDNILMVANPYKVISEQRIYLTTLEGVPLCSRKINNAGKTIKHPEDWLPKTIFLFKDCFNNSHLLTKDKTWQIYLKYDSIWLIYPTDYPDFLSSIFLIKQQLNNKIYYQLSGETYNSSYYKERGKDQVRIKIVRDQYGDKRYVEPFFAGRPSKMVSAPIIKKDEQIIIFDFFANNIEFFNKDGVHEKEVPISFHIKQFTRLLFFTYYDIDQKNFMQKILFDEGTNKAYALYRKKSNGRYSLKEIDLENGKIIRTIEIPDYPFIENIQIKDNVVYFIYLNRVKNYKSLYRMKI